MREAFQVPEACRVLRQDLGAARNALREKRLDGRLFGPYLRAADDADRVDGQRSKTRFLTGHPRTSELTSGIFPGLCGTSLSTGQ